MDEAARSPRLVRFGTFEVDLPAGELRKGGLKLKLTGQPFQVLAILLERPGEVVTREEFQKRLWPDTFVDVDHNLNTAINKIREVLGDSAESPRFVETLPRRGYRFIAPVEIGRGANAGGAQIISAKDASAGPRHESRVRSRTLFYSVVAAGVASIVIAGFFIYKKSQSAAVSQHTLTRVTFDDGLQFGPTWSPDGRFIAYSANRQGKFDIWVQQLSGGDPVQITKGPGHNWQPEWSPDGKYIAYRSEYGEGGLFIVPALGGEGLSRRIATSGHYPHWSPDGSEILFQATQFLRGNRFFVVSLDGSPPREVLTEFFAKHHLSAMSAGWHPDGKRVSVWVWDTASGPNFWTVQVAGGEGVRSEFDPQIARQFQEFPARGTTEWFEDFKFSWAPSGREIYFERTFRGARNLWKMTVDRVTLRCLAIERLTTGPGTDTDLALSPDGMRLAFSGQSKHLRAWLFPFDSTRGRVTGAGQPVTPPGMWAWSVSLTRDGKKLAFCATRTGKGGLWERSLVDGREGPVVADDYVRDSPEWSPDGTRLASWRGKSWTEGQIVVWPDESHNEQALTASSTQNELVWDWSPDGNGLLITREATDTHRMEVWLLSAAPVPGGAAAARRIVFRQGYDLYQPMFSPDGRWIAFQAIRNAPTVTESILYVTPPLGGPWIQITDGRHWDDKPRWAPDGKTLYFLSGRGFFNVWGIHFDPTKGRAVGDPFPVTTFESPSLMVPLQTWGVDLSLNQDKLVLTMEELSGSIWVLDNVGSRNETAD